MASADLVRSPTQPRAHRTRGALVAAAQREFSKRGYASTTAKTIAQEAGVATGSFYQYFPDKDAVLRELGLARFESITQGMRRVLDSDAGAVAPLGADFRAHAEAKLRTIVELAVAYHREDPGLHAVLTERRHLDAELDALTSGAEAAFVTELARLLARWEHPGDVEATAFVLFHMVEGAVHAHVLGHAVVDDARFTSALVDSLVRSALPSPARHP